MTVTREGRLLRVTLDAPERKNALNAGDCRALWEAVHDGEAGAVLIDAKGPYFCAGVEAGVDTAELWGKWDGAPVVVAVQGPAMDEGLGLLARAHVVVAAQGTSFALTSLRSGVFPSAAYWALAAAVGERRAMELALTSRVFTAQDALAWGLVHYVAPAFEFDDRAEAIATAIAQHSLCLRDVLF